MRRDAWWSVALTALACACSGSDSGKTGSPVETDDDPSMVPADQDDTSDDDTSDEGAPPGDGDGDGDDDDPSEEGVIGYDPGDAGVMADGGPVVIEIPVRKIMCGSTECQTTDNRVCCESWSKATGFDKEPMCIAEATCTQTYNQYTGENGRAVLSVCEGAEDCPVGQVCCFYTTGMPVFESLIDFTRVGPGAGRSCMTLADCNSDTLGGDPVGLVACSKDEDCSAAGGTCQPELAASVTTGKNGKPRPGVKVCR